MRNFLLCFVLFANTGAAGANPPIIDVRDYGAVSGGETLCTGPIQRAIDEVSAAGGGTVLVSGGTYLSGTLELKSHTRLCIDRGATLLGSPQWIDYRKNRWYALIVARQQEGITICGGGVLDGQGSRLAADVMRRTLEGTIEDPLRGHRPDEKHRPQLIEFVDCREAKVQDVTLKNSSGWVQAYHRCNGLTIDSVTVRSDAYWNNDGLDLDDCRRVRITRGDIRSDDDGICLKSSDPKKVCEDIQIEDCEVRSGASAFKIGTTSRGGFKHITVRRLKVQDTYRSAVAIESVDGGTIDGIDLSGISAHNTGNAIFIRLGQRDREGKAGTVRNVFIRDMTVDVPASRCDWSSAFAGPEVRPPHNLIPSSITGLPGQPVRDVVLERIRINFAGGGNCDRANIPLDALETVPERTGAYPEFSMFGELPAWGLYSRHVEGLTLRDVTFNCARPDFRSAVVMDDVMTTLLERVCVTFAGTNPVLLLFNVHDALIRDCVAPKVTREFIRSIGDQTAARSNHRNSPDPSH